MIVLDGAAKRRPTLVVLSEDHDGPDELIARGQFGYEADRLFQPPFKMLDPFLGIHYTSTFETNECL